MDPSQTYLRVWRYRVRANSVDSFEQAYGSDGPWAQLFATGSGFLGTELVRGADGWYLTTDRWTSAERWDEWLAANGEAYARLDRAYHELTELEEEVLSGESNSSRQSERPDG